MLCLLRKKYLVTVLGEGDRHFFHAKAKNGEILFQSETYTRREDAERAAKALVKARLVMA